MNTPQAAMFEGFFIANFQFVACHVRQQPEGAA
jgi:hypothetical protein